MCAHLVVLGIALLNLLRNIQTACCFTEKLHIIFYNELFQNISDCYYKTAAIKTQNEPVSEG